jgi:molybdenum cofactor biosynthesis enzyme MoaA
MYFDQFGRARACCQAAGNAFGDVATSSIREIWESSQAEAVRDALEHGSFERGCDFCAWQGGNGSAAFARGFDHLRPDEHRPTWPKQLELALTNACNLQCVMCNGSWSSSIRLHREGRPPMAPAYGEAFFEELAEFLPHLESVRFFGGEPFLGAEPLRVMEMLAELDDPPRVTLTTNGTICTDRVKRIVRTLRPHVVVSIDGATTETYDRIRQGAHLPHVLDNLDWFRAELGDGSVTIASCLMTSNWQEFAEVLQLAEGRGLDIGINVVRFPADHSLYHLKAGRLRAVVEQLEATEPGVTGSRLAAWEERVSALRHHLTSLESGSVEAPQGGMAGGLAILEFDDEGVRVAPPALSRWPWLPFPEAGFAGSRPDATAGKPLAAFVIGTDGVLHHEQAPVEAGLDLSALDGQPFEALIDRLTEVYGPPTTWSGRPRRTPADDDRVLVELRGRTGGTGAVALRITARRNPDGRLVGARYAIEPLPPTIAAPGST